MDVDELYQKAKAAGDQGQVFVSGGELRHIIEAMLVVSMQKKQIGMLIAEVLQHATESPLEGLEEMLARVREGSRPD